MREEILDKMLNGSGGLMRTCKKNVGLFCHNNASSVHVCLVANLFLLL
jgi:hypothetical protein